MTVPLANAELRFSRCEPLIRKGGSAGNLPCQLSATNDEEVSAKVDDPLIDECRLPIGVWRQRPVPDMWGLASEPQRCKFRLPMVDWLELKANWQMVKGESAIGNRQSPMDLTVRSGNGTRASS